MDFFLFVLLLVGFATLYVALCVYFLFTLVILAFLALFYIAIRYPRGKEDWPFGFTDNVYLAGMSNVIILVFAVVVPTMPFMGSTLTYPSPAPPEGWELTFNMRDPYLVLLLLVIQAIMWIVVLAILVPYMQTQIAGAMGGGGASSGDWEKEKSKPKIGVG
jgi:hypothetical protein